MRAGMCAMLGAALGALLWWRPAAGGDGPLPLKNPFAVRAGAEPGPMALKDPFAATRAPVPAVTEYVPMTLKDPFAATRRVTVRDPAGSSTVVVVVRGGEVDVTVYPGTGEAPAPRVHVVEGGRGDDGLLRPDLDAPDLLAPAIDDDSPRLRNPFGR